MRTNAGFYFCATSFYSFQTVKMGTLKIKVNFPFVLFVVLQKKAENKLLLTGNSLGCVLHLKVIGCLSFVALFHASFWNLPSYV